MKKNILVLAALLTLSACSLAPEYVRPPLPTPASFKEAGKWISANPTYAQRDRGPWWEVYNDPILNRLEARVTPANQSLQAAYARFQEAQAIAGIARSQLFPTITLGSDIERVYNSANTALISSPQQYNDFTLGPNLAYEIDLWGKVRNQVANKRDQARASAADWASISLSMHAELASDYFTLRGDDAAIKVLDQTVQAYQKAFDLTSARFKGGVSPVSDVDQAQAQLESAKTLSTDKRLQRARVEHAIAVLIGLAPADFSLSVNRKSVRVISIATTVPSALLERRPDISAAELRVMAANAYIGVARAAYFPDFNLLGGIGLESGSGYNFFSAPSLFWSLGPTAAWTLFDGGRINSFYNLATAQYFEAVANYRQTSLTAFQEVEDSLVAIRRLNSEVQTESAAVRAAYRSVTQAEYRYKGGIINYLDVVFTQNIALQAALAEVDIRVARQNAGVKLIKALGGSW
jgi:NodT family efflux transporter outer membrane factor (OMF) lipoprotein